jgi:TonB family protein
MYSQYYGLREDPFGVTPNPHYLYLGGIHAEALASLIYGIENNRGFLTLIGPPGTGKTTLLFHLLESFRATAHTAFIFQTKCTSDEFLRYLLHELGIDDSGKDLVHAHNLFNELLLRAASTGKRVLVIIDEAQNLDRGVLETVRLLSNFETPHSKLLQIILAGQPGLAKELAHYELRQLRQRLASVIHLRPLTPKESSEYIDLRLKIAGYRGAPLFTQNARELLIDQSEGIPRNINILCFNALSIGCALRSRMINEAIIREVIEDSSLEGKPSRALASDRIGVSRQDRLHEPVTVSQPVAAGVPPTGGRRSTTAPVGSLSHSANRTIPKGQSPPRTVMNTRPNGIAANPQGAKDTPRSSRPSDFGPREESVIRNLQVASRAPGHIKKARARRSNSLPFTLTLLLFVLLWSGAVIWRFEFQTSSQASAPRNTKPAVAVNPTASESASRSTENSDRPKPQTNSVTTPARQSTENKKAGRTSNGNTDGKSAIPPANAEALDLTTRSETGEDRSREMPLANGGVRETEPVDPFSGLAHSNTSLPPASNQAIESVASAPTMASISLYPSPRKSTPSYFVAEAELMRSIVPEYPEEARRIKLEGSVVLMATIATDGSVQRIERLSGNPMLAGAASRSVRHWHYRPASVNGKPVEARAKIVLNFSLHNHQN